VVGETVEKVAYFPNSIVVFVVMSLLRKADVESLPHRLKMKSDFLTLILPPVTGVTSARLVGVAFFFRIEFYWR
jgi:hypothetical protein